VVCLVPRPELAHAELAEVGHEPLDLRAVARDGRQLRALDAQVVAGQVQQHLHAVGACLEDVVARGVALGLVVHDVPRHEVAHALELGRLEERRVEDRRLLVADADPHRDLRRGPGGQQSAGGEQQREGEGELLGHRPHQRARSEEVPPCMAATIPRRPAGTGGIGAADRVSRAAYRPP
jgi:hypothetical protein